VIILNYLKKIPL